MPTVFEKCDALAQCMYRSLPCVRSNVGNKPAGNAMHIYAHRISVIKRFLSTQHRAFFVELPHFFPTRERNGVTDLHCDAYRSAYHRADVGARAANGGDKVLWECIVLYRGRTVFNRTSASTGRKLDLRSGKEERGNGMERASSDVIGRIASRAFCRPSTSTGRSRADRRRIRRYTACARPACRASAARRRRRGCRAAAGA